MQTTPTNGFPRRRFLPPRWFVVTAWRYHRRLVRRTNGRRGLWPPTATKWGR